MKPFFEIALLDLAKNQPLRALELWQKWNKGIRASYYSCSHNMAIKKAERAMWYGGYLRTKFVDALYKRAEFYYKEGKAHWLNDHAEALITLRRSEGADL